MKEPFIEPKDKNEFGTAIDQFYKKIETKQNSGAIFFAVCRGKASEGIDFADANARAVVVLSIPYPNLKDTK